MEVSKGTVSNRIWRQSGRTSSKGTPYSTTGAGAAGHKLRNETGPRGQHVLMGSKVNCKEQRKMTSWLHKRSQCLSINNNTGGLEVRFLNWEGTFIACQRVNPMTCFDWRSLFRLKALYSAFLLCTVLLLHFPWPRGSTSWYRKLDSVIHVMLLGENLTWTVLWSQRVVSVCPGQHEHQLIQN